MRVTLGHFWASFGPCRCRLASVMRIGAGLVGLKAKMCTPFEPEAKSKGGPATPTERSVQRAGVVFRSLWRHFAPFGGTWGSLWGYFVYMRDSSERFWCVFEKNTYFSTFNGFMQSWGELVATLLALGGHVGVTWGICG